MLVLALLLGACALYNLGDDTASTTTVGACPTTRVLTAADLPCSCYRERVTSLPANDCTCMGTDGVLCGSVDTGPGF